MTLYYSINTYSSLKRQHGSNRVVYFWIFSKMTLRCSVLNFFWKCNIGQSKYSISKFSLKWHYPLQFSIFSQKTTWFKPSSLFLDLLKSEITLFSSQFFLKRQHLSNQGVHFYIFSKVILRCSVLNSFWKDNIIQTKKSFSKFS